MKMKIDCGRCVMRGAGCQDCVVTVLNPTGAMRASSRTVEYLDEAEVRALGVLANAGLVPPLRLSLPGSQLRPQIRTWAQPDAKAS